MGLSSLTRERGSYIWTKKIMTDWRRGRSFQHQKSSGHLINNSAMYTLVQTFCIYVFAYLLNV